MTTRPAPLHALAAELNASAEQRGITNIPDLPGALVFASGTGALRLARRGEPVVTLGSWRDDTAALVAAFHEAVAS